MLSQAPALKATCEKYRVGLLEKYPHTCLLKFEAMRHDFENWLDTLLTATQCTISAGLRAKILAKQQQVTPTAGNQNSHYRKGKQGDYLEKLQPNTVRELNAIFDKELAGFGYD